VSVLDFKVPMFRKRFIESHFKTRRTTLCGLIAKTVAEDANTKIYVQEYEKGNHSCRADFIEYLANRIEFILDKEKIL
jgi:hypothetical protein